LKQSRRERDRAAQILRLRHDARRARMHAAQVTDAEDLQLYRQLADDWDREADLLENPAEDGRRRPARHMSDGPDPRKDR